MIHKWLPYLFLLFTLCFIDRQVADLIDRRELASRTNAQALSASSDLAGTDGEVALLKHVT